jgi:hypothetical protein
MSGFGLHAVGSFFDVDNYLSQYSLDYNHVWHKGENHYNHSGLVKRLGNEFKLDICEQENIAIEYLREKHNALKALSGWKNVEAVILGISPELQVHAGLVSVCLSFSPLLVSLAGEIGLELAFYIRPILSDDAYAYNEYEIYPGAEENE